MLMLWVGKYCAPGVFSSMFVVRTKVNSVTQSTYHNQCSEVLRKSSIVDCSWFTALDSFCSTGFFNGARDRRVAEEHA